MTVERYRRPFELKRAVRNLWVRMTTSAEDRQEAENALDLALTGSFPLTEDERRELEKRTLN
ncbi:hypothetical protein K2P56_00900 [Patescibacteria group bacterium]|nr:hypothetical protein [Patescibacteria group bacterium]